MAARCLVFLLASLLLAPVTAEAEPVKLRITSQLPASHYVGVNLMQFKDEVERRSEKALSIEVVHGGKLYKDLEVLGAVSSGAIEMGFIVTDHLAEKVPATTILSQPFMFNFEALVKAALSPDQDVRRLLDKAILDATGTRVLWWLPLGSAVILSKGQPAVTPAGISKRRMRVPGKATVEFIEHCGGSASILNAGEQLSAIQSGKVDMTMTAVTGAVARQLWKVADTIARTDNSAIEFERRHQ